MGYVSETNGGTKCGPGCRTALIVPDTGSGSTSPAFTSLSMTGREKILPSRTDYGQPPL